MDDNREDSSLFEDIPQVNTEQLSSSWREAGRGWGHSLHTLSPYVGGFPPSLPHYFIQRFTTPGDIVLDPFCGGGTTPLQACLTGRKGWGSDAFEYAKVISQAKCNPVTDTNFEETLGNAISKSKTVDNANMNLLDNEDLSVFYSEYTLDKLLRLREVMSTLPMKERTYLNAIICGVLHGPSEMFLSVSTKDTYASTAGAMEKQIAQRDLEKPDRDVRPSARRKHELVTKHPIDASSFTSNIQQSDTRNLPYPDESVDLLLTSPPYLSVLDYTWNNWIRLWWLGADRKSEQDSLDLTADISKYRQFIRKSLIEFERVMNNNSVAVIVVGDVKKHQTNTTELIITARLIAEEASRATNLSINQLINDAYEVENRGYAVFNQLKHEYSKEEQEQKASTPIDRCLILTKGNPDIDVEPEINWSTKHYTGQRDLSQF